MWNIGEIVKLIQDGITWMFSWINSSSLCTSPCPLLTHSDVTLGLLHNQAFDIQSLCFSSTTFWFLAWRSAIIWDLWIFSLQHIRTSFKSVLFFKKHDSTPPLKDLIKIVEARALTCCTSWRRFSEIQRDIEMLNHYQVVPTVPKWIGVVSVPIQPLIASHLRTPDTRSWRVHLFGR